MNFYFKKRIEFEVKTAISKVIGLECDTIVLISNLIGLKFFISRHFF